MFIAVPSFLETDVLTEIKNLLYKMCTVKPVKYTLSFSTVFSYMQFCVYPFPFRMHVLMQWQNSHDNMPPLQSFLTVFNTFLCPRHKMARGI